MKNDLIMLPIDEPDDTDEAFARKLTRHRQQTADTKSVPDEAMVIIEMRIPPKLYAAFERNGRMDEIFQVADQIEVSLRQLLLRKYYEKCT